MTQTKPKTLVLNEQMRTTDAKETNVKAALFITTCLQQIYQIIFIYVDHLFSWSFISLPAQ